MSFSEPMPLKDCTVTTQGRQKQLGSGTATANQSTAGGLGAL